MPSLSVVIPTVGRPAELARALERLEAQRGGTASGLEVLVVQDEESARDPAVARQLEGRVFAGRHLRSADPGVSAKRNSGWRAAAAPVVLFLGDDVLADPDLVAEHVAWHERHPEGEAGVLGHVRWADELRATPFMRWLDRGFQFDYERIEGQEAGWGRLYTSNVSIKRAMLERVGGFDESFPFGYEDLDLGRRLDGAGFRLLYNERARAEHLHRPTLDEWRARMRTVAVAERRFTAKHPDVRPYFHDLFAEALARPRARGRGARLARVIPPGTPWLGPRAWASVDAYYRQQLAEPFLAAWEQAGPGAPPPP